jgi:hypothetical protein
MTTLLKNWHFMRLLRAGIAIWVFAEFWRTSDWILLAMGSFFAVQAIFDVGCCGAAGCAPQQRATVTPPGNQANHPEEEIIFEEVK